MLQRILFNIFIAIAIFTVPWQSYVLFILAGFFLYNSYYEGIAWGILLDALAGGGIFEHWWYSLYALGAWVIVAWSKHILRFYD